MKIKLSRKLKVAGIIGLVSVSAVAGVFLDRTHRNYFTINEIPVEGETQKQELLEEPKVSSEQQTEDANELGTEKAAAAADSGGKININTASVQELTELKGVGESVAERIVEYREKYGDFQNIEELVNVNGIGESKLNSWRDLICVE